MSLTRVTRIPHPLPAKRKRPGLAAEIPGVPRPGDADLQGAALAGAAEAAGLRIIAGSWPLWVLPHPGGGDGR